MRSSLFAFLLAVISFLESCAQVPVPINRNFNPETGESFLINVKNAIPSIQVEMKYLGNDNFLGVKVDGYYENICYLSRPATQALKLAQEELIKSNEGFSLKLYDCYRPQRAVDHFVRWAKLPIVSDDDRAMKAKYYPNIDPKEKLFEGYIAKSSGHTRGSTIDVYLVKWNKVTKKFEDVDMGSIADLLDPLSHTVNPKMSTVQQTNRLKLKTLLEKYGFKNYAFEWWHYTYRPEAYPATYFDFTVGENVP